MRPAPSRKESVDERATSKEWRDLGGVELKVMKCNHNGWPDRWYRMASLGIPGFWCEWKRIGEEPNEQQTNRHDEIREQGDIVIVAHSRREFWDKVRELQTEHRK